jgi:hypothetical protein
MRKLLLLSLLCLSHIVANGQPVFTSNYDIKIGQSIVASIFENHNFTPGGKGNNQTWSYPNVGTGLTSFSAAVVSPSETPYASTFPTANKVFKVDEDSILFYRYYADNATQSIDLGSVLTFPNGGDPIVDKLLDPRKEAQYPLNLGQSFTDTYFSRNVSDLGGVQMIRSAFGTFKFTYDGAGTITTPAGTFTNAIRIHIHEIRKDTTSYPGFPVPPLVSEMRSSTYLWMINQGNQFPVKFQLEYDTVLSGIQDPQIDNSGYYTPNVTSVLADQQALEISVFPNPAKDQLFWLGMKADEVLVVSADGRFIPMPYTSESLPVSTLSPGLYQVRLRQGDRWFVSRFQKQ